MSTTKQSQHPSTGRNASKFLASLCAVLFFAAACGSSGNLEESSDIVAVLVEQACLERGRIEEVSMVFCMDDLKDGTVKLVAEGLKPGSQLTVGDARGNTANSDVSEQGTEDLTMGGDIVAGDFSVRGTWADGEELSVTFERQPN